MTGPLHTPAALAEFQNGEERMVYARHKGAAPNTPPYYLVDGTAREKELKAWVREHLECLMPECPDRRLTAVNRSEHSGRRDGFSHHQGAGKHGLEGLFHQQGKALIQNWVAARYPDAQVHLEVATETGERIADVMVTWPTGQQMAVEIQYAPLTVEAWLERQQSYLRQGITPVWLLGHHGAHMKTARTPTYPSWDAVAGQVQLSLLHQKMTEHNATVIWINPVDRTVGTPWALERIDGTPAPYKLFCRSTTTRAFFAVEPLDQCDLDPRHGLITPAMRLLLQSEENYTKRLTDTEAAATKAEEARRAAEQALHALREEQRTAWLAQEAIAQRAREASEARVRRLQELRSGTARPMPATQSSEQGASPTSPAPTGPADSPPAWTHCRACSLRLDPVLHKIGYHYGCEPPQTDPHPNTKGDQCEQEPLF